MQTKRKLFLCGSLGTCKYLRNIADSAAKEALNTEPTAGLVPFSKLKPLTSKYVCDFEVWQSEWDEAHLVSNQFHEILSKLSGKLLSFYNT